MPDDHSAVDPLLPISNRTVKRSGADDSGVRPRESRKLSGSYLKTPVAKAAGVFLLDRTMPACENAFSQLAEFITRGSDMNELAGMNELADKLWNARVNGTVVGLQGLWQPTSKDEAHQIQSLIYELAGHERLGFKVGSTSKEAQTYLGSSGPNCAELMSPYVYTSPATVSVSAAHGPQLEGEFAFKLGKDLPPRSTPYTVDEITDAIAAVAGAIEIVGSRIADGLANAGAVLLTADCGANIGLVIGKWQADWMDLDLPTHPVQMFINNQLCGYGTGSKALDNPLNVMVWLANRQSETGRGLRRGEIISTGTCTGLDAVNAGDKVRADFGSLGFVDVLFSG